MALKRLDNVGLVVEDLPAAIAFFTALGLKLEAEMTVEGPWVDSTIGLHNVRSDIAMMRTPDDHNRMELAKFHRPATVDAGLKNAPANTLGLVRLMFAVDDIDDAVARLRAHGGELIGEVTRYEDLYRLCYMRGPAGLIVALAQQLGEVSL